MSVEIDYEDFYTILFSCVEVADYHCYLTDEETDEILDKLRLVKTYLEKI